MAFTLEGNFALKDMIIRSDFRLADVEIRVGDTTSRQRVSTTLQRKLGAAEQQRELVESQILSRVGSPPQVFAPPAITPAPATPSMPVGSTVGVGEVLGRQVYTVRNSNSPNNVTRTVPITSDGILTRVSGGITNLSDLSEFDEGMRLLISDVDQATTVDRVSGDRDLFHPQIGVQTTGRHGIGVSQEVSAVGHASVDNFEINFARPVRVGQRFGVDVNAGDVTRYWVAFEVTQFAPVVSSVEIIRERIVESVRLPSTPVDFIPVMMRHAVLAPRVVQNQHTFNTLFFAGYVPVGNVNAGQVSLV